MFEQFNSFIKPFAEKLENVLKIGSYTKTNGKDGQLQKIQLKTLRNIEDALKVSQFGFNSKAPTDSRCVVAEIGNEKIVIANEHIASIIDISSGNTVVYNEAGHTIKIEGDTITVTAPNIVLECDDHTINSKTTTINASASFTVNSPSTKLDGGTVTNDGTAIDNTHTHAQGNDSAGNSQVPTNPPS